MPPGRLYIVSTPIGNLEDMTYRAVRVLKEVNLIACEDTRESRKLLDHFGIETGAVSYHEHNEVSRAVELLERIEEGESVAVITDAGTPLLSDPGYRIVHLAAERGITVVPVPGASALLTALAASGLPTDSFRFSGFLPAKSAQRRKAFEEVRPEKATVIFYETPHRILESLDDAATILPDRPMVLARELTKMHEEFLRGTAGEIKEKLSGRPVIRGEMTLLIGKATNVAEPEQSLEEHVAELMRAGVPRMDAIKEAARSRGLSKRQAYFLLESGK
jgi:16S rRNA (cytidine1402-2'-O)-methyltransferase